MIQKLTTFGLFALVSVTLVASSQAQEKAAPQAQKLRVGILTLDGSYITEFSGPLDVFHHVSPDKVEVFTISDTDKEMKSYEGMPFRANYTIQNAPKMDVLVVPSAIGSLDKDLQKKEMMNWLRTSATDAKIVQSVCQGSFLLATAGLLDGKEATTSGGSLTDFEKRFPNVRVNKEDRVVVDGNIVSTPGGLSAYEASLYVVRELFGEAEAKNVAAKLSFSQTNIDASVVGK
jgi:transcriptional regulator GlxA family with amidase domain